MFHNFEIKEGAIIVSDAHFSHMRPQFFEFLKAINERRIEATQLILMGDMFDALFGGVPYTLKQNSEPIRLLDKIGQRIEVLYLEGNHDFQLKDVFLHVKTIPFAQQPFKVTCQNKKVLLAHGDFDAPLGYQIYTKIIRNPIVLFTLRWIDTLSFHFILKKLDKYLSKKDDCKEFIGFEKFIIQRFKESYECDYFLEGHYHQNKGVTCQNFQYINLGAFACNQRYFVVQSIPNAQLLEEKSFS